MTRVSVLWISGWYIADVNKHVFVNRQGHFLHCFSHHNTPLQKKKKKFWFSSNTGKYTELHRLKVLFKREVKCSTWPRLDFTTQYRFSHAWQHPDKGTLRYLEALATSSVKLMRLLFGHWNLQKVNTVSSDACIDQPSPVFHQNKVRNPGMKQNEGDRGSGNEKCSEKLIATNQCNCSLCEWRPLV